MDCVLIPRQDTELLIDLIFKEYKKETQMNICDLGTGSGIIGITLAKQYKKFTGYTCRFLKKSANYCKRKY